MKTPAGPATSKSILLVEDEKVVLELLAVIIARKFPDVVLHSAGNGKTGLELFKLHTPDIVITDINMPEMGGEQMAGKIRKIKPGTKIIVITGDPDKLKQPDSLETRSEFDHYIGKPVSFGVLFATIEQCLGENVLRNHNYPA